MQIAVRRLVRACTTLFLIPVLFACNDGSGPIVPPPTPSISISVAPATLELNQGVSGTVTVTLTRSGGFTGAVTVAVEGLPTGATAPGITIAAGAASGTLNIGTAGATPAATSALTVRATGTGVTAATASVNLTVRAVVSPTPAFAIGLSSAAATIAAGANGTATVNVTRTGGFTGPVALSATVAPAGPTVSFDPASVTGASSTMTVTVGAGVAAGSYAVTVRGTATGLTDQTATFNVTVTAPAAGGFTLGLSAAAATVQAGNNANATVNVNRTGSFTGAVALSATVAPAGPTVSFNPASVTGASSAMTVTVGAGVAAGAYAVTVRGTAAGQTDQTATFNVTVTAGGGGGGGSANWVFCPDVGLPVWVAFQSENGAWTRVTGNNNTYSFTINGARGGVAYVVATASGGFDLEVFYGSKAEIETQGGLICAGSTSGVTVNGTVAGAGGTDLIMIGMARSIGTAASNNTTFSIPGVPTGSFDLIAGKSTLSFGGGGVTFTPDKFFLARAVSSASSPAIDFNGANGFTPASATVTTNNLGADVQGALMSYFTANSLGSFYVDAFPAGGATRTYFGVPGARQQNGDFHYLNVIALPSLQNTTQTRQAGIAFREMGNKTVTLGPVMNAPTVTSQGGGRMRLVYQVQAEYGKFFIANYQQGSGVNQRISSLMMTTAYNQGGATATIDIPDFSGVAGFDTNWYLKTGVSTTWTSTATGWPGAGGITGSPLTEGAVYQSGTRIGTITP